MMTTAAAAVLHLLQCCMYKIQHPAWLLNITLDACILGSYKMLSFPFQSFKIPNYLFINQTMERDGEV